MVLALWRIVVHAFLVRQRMLARIELKAAKQATLEMKRPANHAQSCWNHHRTHTYTYGVIEIHIQIYREIKRMRHSHIGPNRTAPYPSTL